MNPVDFAEKMREASDVSDPESSHVVGDDLMCEVLTDLGYGEGVSVFCVMRKWYA